MGRREAARAVNLAAARQYSDREEHLRVPRQAVEVLPEGTEIKRGCRRRQHPPSGRQTHLGTGARWDTLGMRW